MTNLPSDPRFNTGDAELDRALEQDDAKLRAMGAYDEKPAPYAREFIYTDVAGGNWRVFRREDDSRVATCWDAYNAQLIVDALNRDAAAPSVSSSAPAADVGRNGVDVSRQHEASESQSWLVC